MISDETNCILVHRWDSVEARLKFVTTKFLLLTKLAQNVKIKVVVSDEIRLEWELTCFVKIKVVVVNKSVDY